MSSEQHPHGSTLSADLLAELGRLSIAGGLALLADRNMRTTKTAAALSEAALARAETTPESAMRWLEIAKALNQSPESSQQDPNIQAQIGYAQARLHLLEGELVRAEEALTAARAIWAEQGNQASLNRSALGLTQILAMQGRHAEAEDLIHQTIANLSVMPSSPETLMRLEDAEHNLATLLLYQERHGEALAHYQLAEEALDRTLFQVQGDPDEDDAEWQERVEFERAHANLNRASALMALDRLQEAEDLLLATHATFERYADRLNRGRTSSNLGSLFLRTGRYTAALAHFEDATKDLLGEDLLLLPTSAEEIDADELERLRQADTLLLEQSMAYLALNLRNEAATSLARCQALFRSAEMPYELGQTLWTWGRLRLGDGEYTEAEALLSQANALFAQLQNAYWQNRTRLDLAMTAYRQGKHEEARPLAETLPMSLSSGGEGALDGGSANDEAITTDIALVVETHLLRIRLALADGDSASAGTLSDAVLAELKNFAGEADPEQIMPHIWLRVLHVRGQVARARGQWQEAQEQLYAAINLLEEQRTTLALEEVRTAYLDDKMDIYRDLILALIDAPRGGGDSDDTDRLRAAFDAVERARSRALLERLLATFDAKEFNAEGAKEQDERWDKVRQELHWLYNRLMGDAGSRNLNPDLGQKIKQQEDLLERLEMRRAPLRQMAQPAGLSALQESLELGEQVLVFYIATAGINSVEIPTVGSQAENRARHRPIGREIREGNGRGEVMAFLVDREEIRLFRHLCSEDELVTMQDELRFQMGRAELGEAYVTRHGKRLRRALHEILQRLFDALIDPIVEELEWNRLLIVPYGALHLLPFHLLWDGEQYMLERCEISYVPSATVAIHCATASNGANGTNGSGQAYAQTTELSWAGLAVTDPMIPQAQQEVKAVAGLFADAQIFLAENAGLDGLHRAAKSADLLHIATHGLFRADNPFFSALKLDDGWINVREIYRLPLAARLVVLSACDSGLGKVRSGDELIGLVRGFLAAGAPSLIASLWTVNDASAARLMQDFYRELTSTQTNGWSPAKALRKAQLGAIERGDHPYYWASFYMVGR